MQNRWKNSVTQLVDQKSQHSKINTVKWCPFRWEIKQLWTTPFKYEHRTRVILILWLQLVFTVWILFTYLCDSQHFIRMVVMKNSNVIYWCDFPFPRHNTKVNFKTTTEKKTSFEQDVNPAESSKVERITCWCVNAKIYLVLMWFSLRCDVMCKCEE